MKLLKKLKTMIESVNTGDEQEYKVWEEEEVKLDQEVIHNISPLADITSPLYEATKNSNSGLTNMPFVFDIYVAGDSDKYYPVYIPHQTGQNAYISTELLIYRSFRETAPNNWHSSTHKGGLNVKILYTSGGWGGFPEILRYETADYTYAPQFAGAKLVDKGYGLCVWLRGGGAVYHLASTQELEVVNRSIAYSKPTVYLQSGITTFSDGSEVSLAHRPRTQAVIDEISNKTVSTNQTISIDASQVASGVLADARIPSLNASKITAGTFSADRIPTLDASKINSGTLADARIPNLNASKITAGTFAVDRIPNLDASKITSGLIPYARLAFQPASLINSGVFSAERIPPVNSMVIHDRRTSNPAPNWYYSNYPRQKVVEFKLLSAIGITAALGAYGTYCSLETFCPWNDSSGGGVSQVAYNLENRTIWTRRGSTTAWGAWLMIA